MDAPPRSSLIAGLLVAVASLGTVGCGMGADRNQVRAATERFAAALAHKDGATACAQLSSDLSKQVAKDEKEPTCARAVLKVKLQGTRAAAVHVYATSAQVDLVDGDTVFLGDTPQGWRLEAVGCKRQGTGPFECEEQA